MTTTGTPIAWRRAHPAGEPPGRPRRCVASQSGVVSMVTVRAAALARTERDHDAHAVCLHPSVKVC
jgi:hypothetical protein